MSTCELEVDALAADILNRLQIDGTCTSLSSSHNFSSGRFEKPHRFQVAFTYSPFSLVLLRFFVWDFFLFAFFLVFLRCRDFLR